MYQHYIRNQSLSRLKWFLPNRVHHPSARTRSKRTNDRGTQFLISNVEILVAEYVVASMIRHSRVDKESSSPVGLEADSSCLSPSSPSQQVFSLHSREHIFQLSNLLPIRNHR